MSDSEGNNVYHLPSHLPQLDGLRGMAIILVLFYHFFGIFSMGDDLISNLIISISEIGWVGVDLFFVLSGFLITGILKKSKGKGGYFKNFYARRTVRIFPLYYLNLAIFFVLIPIILKNVPDEISKMAQSQFFFWTYLTNWYFAFQGSFNETPGGYFWSLAVEEQFYLFWPFVVYFISTENLKKLCVLLFGLCFLLRATILFSGLSTTAAYTITFTHMDGLVAGSWLALMILDGNIGRDDRYRAKISISICLSVLFCIWLWQGTFHFWNFYVALVAYSVLAILFCSVLLLVLFSEYDSLVFKLSTFVPIKSFGIYSYSLYLIHVPLYHFLKKILYPGLNAVFYNSKILPVMSLFFVSVTLVWILGYLSWNLYEKHFLAIKKYFV